MTPLERIQTAIARLETQRDAITDEDFKIFLYYYAGTPSRFEVLMMTLHSTIEPVLELLRGALRYTKTFDDAPHGVVLALADAILGDAK